MLKLRTLLGFLAGRSSAIQSVASSSASPWLALMLILLASIPRNYDQTWIGEKTFLWLFGPLLAAVFNSLLFFTMFERAADRSRRKLLEGGTPPEIHSYWKRYGIFFGLYGMTAPLAWLYAIPVKRWLTIQNSGHVNVALLAIVSLWRVLLLARVVSVVRGASFSWCLQRIVQYASMEVILLVYMGASAHIARGMMGMRNAPEEYVLQDFIRFVFISSLVLFVVTTLARIWNVDHPGRAWPEVLKERIPWAIPVGMALFGALILPIPQKELHRNFQHRQRIEAGQYRKALEVLSQHQKSDYAPAQRLAPNPYEFELFEDLPPLLAAVQGDEAPWVREWLRDSFLISLKHYHFRHEGGVQGIVAVHGMCEGLSRLPETRVWESPSGFPNPKGLESFGSSLPEWDSQHLTEVSFEEQSRMLLETAACLERWGVEGMVEKVRESLPDPPMPMKDPDGAP